MVLLRCVTIGTVAGCVPFSAGGQVSTLIRTDTKEPVVLATPDFAAGGTWGDDSNQDGGDDIGGDAFYAVMGGWAFDIGYERRVGFTGASYPFVDLKIGRGDWGYHARFGAGVGFDQDVRIRGIATVQMGVFRSIRSSATRRTLVSLDLIGRRPSVGECTITPTGEVCGPDQAWQLGAAVSFSFINDVTECSVMPTPRHCY